MEILFDSIPLGDVTTSMTISGPAVPVFCMYVVAAERQGVDIGTLNGTLQTDIFKEYIAQKEWLFAPEPHLRLIGDLMEYTTEKMPAYKPLSVSGYHIREAGATAAQELAYTLLTFNYVFLKGMRDLGIPHEKVNVQGGAIALGHPLAASGVRLMIQLAAQFKERPDVRYGLTTMCIGLGMGGSVIWENPNFDGSK